MSMLICGLILVILYFIYNEFIRDTHEHISSGFLMARSGSPMTRKYIDNNIFYKPIHSHTPAQCYCEQIDCKIRGYGSFMPTFILKSAFYNNIWKSLRNMMIHSTGFLWLDKVQQFNFLSGAPLNAIVHCRLTLLPYSLTLTTDSINKRRKPPFSECQP